MIRHLECRPKHWSVRRSLPLYGAIFAISATWSAIASAQQAPMPVPASGVRDTAGLFGSAGVEDATNRLRELEREVRVPTIIETIDSLRGESVDEVAISLARRSGTNGIFVLIAKRETKIEVLPSHRVESALPRAKRNAVRTAFIENFRKKDFDAGLKHGVEAIAAALRDAAHLGKLPRATDPIPPVDAERPESTKQAAREFGVFRNVGRVPISIPIVRDRIRLTLEGAQIIIDGARQQAESMKLKANIWVVDDGGHPLAFIRMEGGRPASAYTSLTKAVSAATFRQATGPIPSGAAQPSPILNIGLQNAATAGGGKITTLFGGIPIIVDGQVIGGIGVGGGTGEQDAKVATAGLELFLDRIRAATQSTEKATETAKPTNSPPAQPKDTNPPAKPGNDGDF
jgi:glc operon protein GlcG